MSNSKIVAFGLLIGCLALPAFAQSTSNCQGQPWGGMATGGVGPFLALPAMANDQFITGNGANCIAGPAPDVDSIWCFTPASSCSATFTVTGLGGGETVAFNLYSGPCAGSPTSGNCQGSATATGANISTAIPLTGGTQYCAYYATDVLSGSTAMASLVDATSACGVLPVEIQKFTVNDGEEEEAESPPEK